MTLVTSGQISMGDINEELGRSRTAQISLDTAENGGYGAINPNGTGNIPSATNPAQMSEWYGYDHNAAPAVTYTLVYTGVSVDDMCAGIMVDIYTGSDEVYYYTGVGGGAPYTELYNAGFEFFIYQYYDYEYDAFVWEGFQTDSSSTVFFSTGNYVSPCGALIPY